MDFLSVETLTFGQLLILVLIGVALISFFAIRGFIVKKRGTTLIVGRGGRKVRVSKTESFNVVLLLEALKAKDDIHDIERYVFRYQKRYTRETLPQIQAIQLEQFAKLLREENPGTLNIYENRDYLYYVLLLEKMYTALFADILDSMEQNGLASKDNPNEFAEEKASRLIRNNLPIIDSMYLGIITISKQKHDHALQEILPEMRKKLKELFIYAINIAKQGKEKKEQLESYLFNKIGAVEGISKEQFDTLFSGINSEDFLDI